MIVPQNAVVKEIARSLDGFNIGLSAAIPERSAWTECALDRAVLECVSVFSALIFKWGGRIVHDAHPTFTPIIVRQARRHAGAQLQKPVTLVISELWAKLLDYDEASHYQEVAEIFVTDQVGEDGLENIETRKASLTLMRRHLIQRMNTMVAVDGKPHETEDSVSGVFEEVGLAARRGMACFLVGLMADAVKEQSSLISFPENGLTPEQNQQLQTTKDVAACVSVVFDHLMWHHELAKRELLDLDIDVEECVDYDVFLRRQIDEPGLSIRKQRVRAQLRPWLEQNKWEIDQLVDFLEGQGPAPVAHHEEAYHWLLSGLPKGSERDSAVTELAQRAAALLKLKPDQHPFGNPPERLLYNLLHLCAGLSCPNILAKPLFEMWSRKKLVGQWLDYDLRHALRTALARNQLDARLRGEWKAMIDRRAGEFLLGNPYGGFEGILYMPESPQKRGEPFLDAIAQALAKMARFLQENPKENPKRRPKFQALIQKVINAYPGRPTWDEDLIRLADRHRFPPEAVECLPSLFVELGSSGDKLVTVLLWYPFKNWLDAYHDKRWRQIKSLCKGQVVEVQMELALLIQLREICPYFEKTRRELPFSSEGAMKGVIKSVMSLLLDPILSIFDRKAQPEKGKFKWNSKIQQEGNMVNSIFPTP